jgi:hypothetical protein
MMPWPRCCSGNSQAIGLVLASVALFGCARDDTSGAERAKAAQRPAVQARPLPLDFDNVYFARLAGSDRSLWELQAGRTQRRRQMLTVKLRSMTKDGRWSPSVRLPDRVIEGVPLTLTLRGEEPCVTGSTPQRLFAKCWSHGRWRIHYQKSVRAGTSFVQDAVSINDHLLLLLSAPAKQGARSYELLRLGPRRPDSVAKISFRGSAALSSDGLHPELVAQDFEGTGVDRRFYTIRNDRWVQSRPPVVGYPAGPQTSGPASADSTTVQAVNVGSGDVWPFRVVVNHGSRWPEVNGGPLNRTPGRAQGAVFAAAGDVWAIWQEHAERPRGMFDAAVFAARVETTADELVDARRLWSGISIGPGDLAVTEAYGAVWALAMRAPRDGRPALQPFVSRLDTAG